MKKSLIASIAQKLKRKISSGEISSRIIEQDIAQEYGVSRTPVREVIRELVKEGLLTSIPNLGTFVKQYSIQEIKNIYEIRGALEGLAAALAARRINANEGDSLLCLAKDIENKRLAENWNAVYELDKQFHKFIALYSRNQNLEKALDDYDFKITCAYANLFQADRFKGNEFKGISHIAIAEAVKSGDSEKSEKLIKEHIAWAKQRILTD
ncbi:MAG: GntR family transcriptional regulator [Victivallaceae bacterium]|nr:GntR family transcriptional regulator [Victivallaceae bacterium]